MYPVKWCLSSYFKILKNSRILPFIFKYILAVRQLKKRIYKAGCKCFHIRCQKQKKQDSRERSRKEQGYFQLSHLFSRLQTQALLVPLVPTYIGSVLTGHLTHALASMTFWKHLSMYFGVFKHRKVTKLVRLRFCQVLTCKCFLAIASNEADTHTQFSQTLGKEGLHRGTEVPMACFATEFECTLRL